jgi:hypothetical protein
MNLCSPSLTSPTLTEFGLSLVFFRFLWHSVHSISDLRFSRRRVFRLSYCLLWLPPSSPYLLVTVLVHPHDLERGSGIFLRTTDVHYGATWCHNSEHQKSEKNFPADTLFWEQSSSYSCEYCNYQSPSGVSYRHYGSTSGSLIIQKTYSIQYSVKIQSIN